jgi:Uncharacterised protein family (UPF0236)
MDQGKRTGSLLEGNSAFNAVIGAIQSCSSIDGAATADEIAKSVSAELGIPVGRVAAIVAGWESLACYGLSTLADEVDALQEEESALAASREALRPVFESRLQERIDSLEATSSAPSCGHPECGATMGSKGQRTRGWQSTMGSITLRRRWSVCPEPGHGPGRSVAQEQLLLPAGRYTARLSESLTMLATTVPHGMACQLAGRLLGTEVSEHAIQDQVHERAKTLMAADEVEAEELNPFEDNGLEREVAPPSDVVTVAPAVAYVEVDGVFAMTRQLDEERSAPVPNARGGKGRRYNLEGKEVKNAVLYTADACAEESPSRGCLIEKQYVSMLGTWTAFALLLWVAIRRLRFDQAKVLVVLSDGAKWIRELAQWLPCSPHVLLILDLYHAIHRVYEVASAVFGDTPEGRQWREQQKLDIEQGLVEHVIDRLRFLRPTGTDASKKVAELITYFENNQDRMDYPSYRRRGLRISTAAVESANYHVTGARLKAQGMRWEEQGGAEMARLRADLFNETWEARTRQALAA